MNRRFLKSLLILAVLFTFFAMALSRIFALQMDSGSAYPLGSSLRAGPEGTMILFESLDKLKGVRARRHLEPIHLLEDDPNETTLVLLSPERFFARSTDLQAFVQAGGRVILRPTPRGRMWFSDREDEGEKSEEMDELLQGADLVVIADSPAAKSEPQPVADTIWAEAEWTGLEDEPAPERIPWRKGAYFRRWDGDVLYSQGDDPVVTRVREGRGEWLLIADEELLLNRSMYNHREPDWLLWLFDGRSRVVFDEWHFGIRRPRGLMTLIRGAGLDVLLWALLIPVGLGLWRGAFPLLPIDEQLEGTKPVALSRLDGYRDLLKQHVPDQELLAHLLAEWQKDASDQRLRRVKDDLQALQADVKAPLPSKGRMAALLERFQRLHNYLTTRKRVTS